MSRVNCRCYCPDCAYANGIVSSAFRNSRRLVPNSHSQDVLNMEYAQRRAFNSLIVEFGLNLSSLLTNP